MKGIIVFFVLINICNYASSQVSDILFEEVGIKRANHNQTIKLSRRDFTESNLIKAFGEFDTKELIHGEAGGRNTILRYQKNYFTCPIENNAIYSFRLSTEDFIAILSDTLKLQVGDSANRLLSIVDVEKNVTYSSVDLSRFGIEYAGNVVLRMYFIVNGKKVYSDALFGVTFDPKTRKIVEISFSLSS